MDQLRKDTIMETWRGIGINYNFMIAVPFNDISTDYVMINLPNIERKLGMPVVIWSGTTPWNMPDTLKFHTYKAKTLGSEESPMTDTEKACWYSHYLLWKHMHENGISTWIFEHDTTLQYVEHFPEVPRDVNVAFGKLVGGMHAYYLRHDAAGILAELAESTTISGQVDTFVHMMMTKFKPPEINYMSFELPMYQLKHRGSTVDH